MAVCQPCRSQLESRHWGVPPPRVGFLSYKTQAEGWRVVGLGENYDSYLKFIQQIGAEQLDVKFLVLGLLLENARER